MKRFTSVLTIILFSALIIGVGCKKKKNTTKTDARDAAGAALSKTWTVTSVTKDDEPREEWADFTLAFTYNAETDMGGYQVAGVPANEGAADVYGENLTWAFQGDDENADTGVIVRSDGVVIQAQLNTGVTALVLSFTITDASARTAGFNGNWIFTLASN
jgi:hypothetical protein